MANSVREFVIESLRGFYERLPLKKVAIDGSVLTPDASGIVNLNVASSEQLEDMALTTAAALNDLNARIESAESSTPWEHGEGENSAQLVGITGATGKGAVAHAYSSDEETIENPSWYIGQGYESGDYNNYDIYNYNGSGLSNEPWNTIIYNNNRYAVTNKNYSQFSTNPPLGITGNTQTYVSVVLPPPGSGEASGSYSHTEGEITNATGDYSHAEGTGKIQSTTAPANILSVTEDWRFSGIDPEEQNYFLDITDYSYYSNDYASIIQKRWTDTVWELYNEWHNNGEDVSLNLFSNFACDSDSFICDLFDTDNVEEYEYNDGEGGYIHGLLFYLDASIAQYTPVYNNSIIKFSASGEYSHTEGVNTIASGMGSHAEGMLTEVKSDYSHAEGYHTIAEGGNSHAEGYNTLAYGNNSHAEGSYTKASGNGAHAEGKGKDSSYVVFRLYMSTCTNSGTSPNPATFNLTSNVKNPFKVGDQISCTNGNVATVTEVTASRFKTDTSLCQAFNTSRTLTFYLRNLAGYDASNNISDASGMYSHTEGILTQAFNEGEHANGLYNLSNTNVSMENDTSTSTLFTIGCGDIYETDSSHWLERKNAVEVMRNGAVYITGIGGYNGTNPGYGNSSTLQEVVNNSGGGTSDFMTSITYSDLKALRDSSSLVPGMQYRITDYECTTTQSDTSVAGHAFDIIVTADSSTVLNENARATWHEGDAYFQNCRLYEWQLKYDLNNDSSLYSWADTSNGKGVVHYMKDEFNNVCYYDFKNVMFKRYMIADSSFDELPYTYTGTYTIGNEHSKLDITGVTNGGVVYDDNDFAWFYTFSAGSLIDVTVLLNEVHLVNGYGLDFACCDNYIEKTFTFTNYNCYLTKKAIMLNNIVIATGEYDGNAIYSWSAIGNYFDFNCESITLHQGCTYRKIGQNCYNIVIFNSIEPETNIVEDYCRNVIIRGDHNFVGHHSEKIYINGENIKLHGNNSYIYLGGGSYPNNVYSSDIGEYCNSISIKGAGQAIIGQGSTDISIGAYSYASIGENCYNITIGEYDNKVTVSERASNFVLSSGTSNTNLSNVTVLPGDYGNATIAFEAGKSYEQYAGINSSNAIKIWTPADLID